MVRRSGRKTTGYMYQRGKSKVYWLEYVVNGKRKNESLGTTDENEAKNERDKRLNPLSLKDDTERIKSVLSVLQRTEESIEALEKESGKLKISDAWDSYLLSKKRPQSGPATLKDLSQRWGSFAKFIKENNPDLTLDEVSDKTLDAFLKTLDGLSPNRYNKIVQTGRLVYRVLSGKHYTGANPFEGIQLKKLQAFSHRELSEGELLKVCQTAEGELRTLFAIGLYTALRLGDAATLQWDEVKLSLNRIVRVPMKTRRTGKSVSIPLHSALQAILEETPVENRAGDVLPSIAAQYRRDKSGLSRKIQAHFATCGIKTQRKLEGQQNASCEVGFHSLRHSFVTMCAIQGVPLPIVQSLCGHGSPAIQRAYIHVGVEQASRAVLAMPDISLVPKALLPASTDALEPLRQEAHELIAKANEPTLRKVLKQLKREGMKDALAAH